MELELPAYKLTIMQKNTIEDPVVDSKEKSEY